ncbi:MAG: diaminopimelate epimerase [Croceibacterium sp.]
MRIPFIKMHGLGNDFVVLDGRDGKLPPLEAQAARAIADRHTGIGCDQVIVLEPSEIADFRMRIRNADGGEVEACGNATRAVAMLHGEPVEIETVAGVLSARPEDGGVAVDMGEPEFGWEEIPLSDAMDTLDMPVGWDELERPTAVNIGNPHVVFFVPDCDKIELEHLGPAIETDPLFPERINVNVATIEAPDAIRLRVWERGAGLTRACGTGACATAVAAMRRKLVGREVVVSLPGGQLLISWGEDGRVTMTGPASESFRGTFDWGAFA